jgi:hypothetical protein
MNQTVEQLLVLFLMRGASLAAGEDEATVARQLAAQVGLTPALLALTLPALEALVCTATQTQEAA